ncbi:potassium-transporting ATPase subunit KdpC [Morganella psychrotolerans]|uniref:Potassium-transporting ATPase KdpC subunit n=1 Tax=Morganella psychrotolerans TaxID=368603 RepID=A0A1B8H487_9GAMM|nr:potassium-transporting ATPase subunit KdpC [Morganella psychrotolerans]OBU03863.1 K+-transporting ATPase subunit C [Morganella psychrotolerans]
MSQIRPAIVIFLVLALVTGVFYPLLTTTLGEWWFARQANGSLIEVNGEVKGSALIGQQFTQPGYFHGRPSETAGTPYNAESSGGSNLSTGNPVLLQRVAQRAEALRAENPDASRTVPVDLVTASASGLDPDISPQAAYWQAPRVAGARAMSVPEVNELISENITTPVPAFTGEPVVNVLELNLALDAHTAARARLN